MHELLIVDNSFAKQNMKQIPRVLLKINNLELIKRESRIVLLENLFQIFPLSRLRNFY